ncbi:MAG: dihydroneopterin aldolase [Planctomycetes bacterium]|nr:dihydroneopterin aldolase [Planctomycetota bacterium]
MMDAIRIDGLLVRSVIGVTDDERRDKQDILIGIVLEGDFREAGRTDDIERAVNYRTINKEVLRFAEASRCKLIETLAEGVAEICLRDPRVVRCRVRIEKPGALRFARTVSVEIVREREGSP